MRKLTEAFNRAVSDGYTNEAALQVACEESLEWCGTHDKQYRGEACPWCKTAS